MESDSDQQPLLGPESTSTYQTIAPDPYLPFAAKYGRCLEILHYGSNSTVRLHQSKNKPSELLAVKVYRYNILDPSYSSLHASCCSSESLANLHPTHPNILPVTDLLYNESSELCLVMPYCAGRDLHELLYRTGPVPALKADYILAQILRGLAFLHEHGIAHRDIRLETVLLTEHGVVKIAGFGDGHIRHVWAEGAISVERTDEEMEIPHSPQAPWWSSCLPWLWSCFCRPGMKGRGTGRIAIPSASFPGISLAYTPPEVFRRRSFRPPRRGDETEVQIEDYDDPRPADVWATAMVYVALITGRLLWKSACSSHHDGQYLSYLQGRTEEGYPPLELFERVFLPILPLEKTGEIANTPIETTKCHLRNAPSEPTKAHHHVADATIGVDQKCIRMRCWADRRLNGGNMYILSHESRNIHIEYRIPSLMD